MLCVENCQHFNKHILQVFTECQLCALETIIHLLSHSVRQTCMAERYFRDPVNHAPSTHTFVRLHPHQGWAWSHDHLQERWSRGLMHAWTVGPVLLNGSYTEPSLPLQGNPMATETGPHEGGSRALVPSELPGNSQPQLPSTWVKTFWTFPTAHCDTPWNTTARSSHRILRKK